MLLRSCTPIRHRSFHRCHAFHCIALWHLDRAALPWTQHPVHWSKSLRMCYSMLRPSWGMHETCSTAIGNSCTDDPESQPFAAANAKHTIPYSVWNRRQIIHNYLKANTYFEYFAQFGGNVAIDEWIQCIFAWARRTYSTQISYVNFIYTFHLCISRLRNLPSTRTIATVEINQSFDYCFAVLFWTFYASNRIDFCCCSLIWIFFQFRFVRMSSVV